MVKKYLQMDVFTAAKARIRHILENFEHFYVCFSGGKDSGVMTQMVLDVAKEMGVGPVPVLFYDWEAIYKETEAFVRRIMSLPNIEPYWVCLPVQERNGSSVYEPFWMPWDPNKKNLWVRDFPPEAIHSGNTPSDWDWHQTEETDWHFFVHFGDWFARTRGADRVANFVAIRTDESYDRMKMLKTRKHRDKLKDENGKILDWCYRFKENKKRVYYTMPIYDWRVGDVWKSVHEQDWDYNHIYDKFHLMGVPVHNMRICNPYGEQQKRGLHQYHKCEPESWFRIVNRVTGANFGNRYNHTALTRGRIEKPVNITWRKYLKLLLQSLPEDTRFHYRRNFLTALKWHRKIRKQQRLGQVLYDTDAECENIGVQDRFLLTWEEMAKCIIKGDYWCKKLCFTETQREAKRQGTINKWKDI